MKPPLFSTGHSNMIQKISASILFQGEKFSPKKATEITGLNFSEMNEVGEIGKKGRYKNKPIPFGYGLLEAPATIPDDDRILWLANELSGKLEVLYGLGAGESRMYIGYFYINQCNCGLTKEELAAIAKLGIDFWFSCYDISDDK